ncbi:uncharacterized protein VTP21DRAFT_10333 [Calcarisporiella thermophila]|uniref:uncharacterized protein n=1 Tax=Calcarisporiella thermophila TaxID=911321 RepID=UPI0037447F35
MTPSTSFWKMEAQRKGNFGWVELCNRGPQNEVILHPFSPFSLIFGRNQLRLEKRSFSLRRPCLGQATDERKLRQCPWKHMSESVKDLVRCHLAHHASLLTLAFGKTNGPFIAATRWPASSIPRRLDWMPSIQAAVELCSRRFFKAQALG